MRLNASVGRFYDYHFVRKGVDWDVGYVSLLNLASMKSSFRDPNRVRVGYAGFLKFGNQVRTFRTRGVREYFSFVYRTPDF